ncbi:hypothetical protein ACSBR2_026697 [Camellia fascicularis]
MAVSNCLHEASDILLLSKASNSCLYSREIFKTEIFGEKTTVICNGNKFLFSNERKIFTGFLPHSKKKLFLLSKLEPAMAPLVPPPHTVASLAADDVKEVIKTPGFFKPEALSSYLGITDSISQQHLKTHWEGKDELNALSEILIKN